MNVYTGCQSHKGFSLRCVRGLASTCISDLAVKSMVIPWRRDMRSSTQLHLIAASHRCQFAERAFAVGSQMLWNSLPDAVFDATSIKHFVVYQTDNFLSWRVETICYIISMDINYKSQLRIRFLEGAIKLKPIVINIFFIFYYPR